MYIYIYRDENLCVISLLIPFVAEDFSLYMIEDNWVHSHLTISSPSDFKQERSRHP